jgi:hypothetical protein
MIGQAPPDDVADEAEDDIAADAAKPPQHDAATDKWHCGGGVGGASTGLVISGPLQFEAPPIRA